jgi:hypothetical protein
MIGKLTAFTIILGLALVALPLFSQDAQAVSVKTTISLDQSAQTAQVAPGQQGIVTFTGSVTCNETGLGSTVQNVQVSLSSSAGGWATTITPSTMTFSNMNEVQTFSVSVKIPPGTSSYISQEMIVGGTAQVVPGVTNQQLEEAKAIINVKQFYKFQINCTEPFIECPPGGAGVYNINILNRGNGQDTIRLEVEDGQEELNAESILLQVSQTEFIIDEGSNATAKVTMIVPSSFRGNQVFSIKLKIYSFKALAMDEIPVETTYPIYLRANSDSKPAADDDDGVADNTTTDDDKKETTPGFEAGLALVCLMMAMTVIVVIDRRRFVH